MQLERYIQQSVAEPVDRSTGMPVPVGNAPQVPGETPLMPYVQTEHPNNAAGLVNLIGNVADFVGGIVKEKQENNANNFVKNDRLDLIDEVASIHEEGDYENAGERIRSFIEDYKALHEEDLNDYGMSKYEEGLTTIAGSYYEELVINEGIETRKANVQVVQNTINDSVKRRDLGGAYAGMAEALNKEYIGIGDIGIKPDAPYFDDFVEAYVGKDGKPPDFQKAANIALRAIEDGYVEKGGMMDSLHQQVLTEGAKNELSIAKGYGSFMAAAYDKNEEGEYLYFPEVTDPEQRKDLQNWAEARYEDQSAFENKKLTEAIALEVKTWQQMLSRGELKLEYLNSEEVVNKFNDIRYTRELESWKAKLKTQNQMREEKDLEEMTGWATVQINDFLKDLEMGQYIDQIDANKVLGTILDQIPMEWRDHVEKVHDIGSIYERIKQQTKSIQKMGIYSIIEDLDAPETMKNHFKSVASRYVVNAIFKDGELRPDAPNMNKLEAEVRVEVGKAIVESGADEMIENALSSLGISEAYDQAAFIKGSEKDIHAGWGLTKRTDDNWIRGLGYMNNGFLINEVDPEMQKKMAGYHEQIIEAYKKGSAFTDKSHEIEDTKVSAGMVFIKDKQDGKWRTLAVRKYATGEAGVFQTIEDPVFMDIEEFSRQHFVPFPVGQKDFDDSIRKAAERVNKKYPSGMVPGTYIQDPNNPGGRTPNDYLVWIGNGYERMSTLIDNEKALPVKDSNGIVQGFSITVDGEEYFLHRREAR